MEKFNEFLARFVGSQLFSSFVMLAVAAPLIGSAALKGHFGLFFFICAVGAFFVSVPMAVLRTLQVHTLLCVGIVAPLVTLLFMGTVSNITVYNPHDLPAAYICAFFIILVPAWVVTTIAWWGGELVHKSFVQPTAA